MDLFATYAYSCRICPLEFFIEFRPKDNKKFQQANVTAIRRMLHRDYFMGRGRVRDFRTSW